MTKRKTSAPRPKHDLLRFFEETYGSMQSQYERIHARAAEDPGTAGDEGEESWAELLRQWLPATYPVVTKGRILNADGVAGPQMDILVLHPDYPAFLRNRKVYLAAGVVAAFECKLTLKKAHIARAIEQTREVKDLYRTRLGTPYDELYKPIIVGLLAHSRSWKGDASDGWGKLDDHLLDCVEDAVEHPRELIDLVCVADAGTLYLTHSLKIGRPDDEDPEMFADAGPDGGIRTCYFGISAKEDEFHGPGAALGYAISYLTLRLAWEDPRLQPYADYLLHAIRYGEIGRPFGWRADVLSPSVVNRLKRRGCESDSWSKWSEDL